MTLEKKTTQEEFRDASNLTPKQELKLLKMAKKERKKSGNLMERAYPERKATKLGKVAILYLRLNGVAEPRVVNTINGMFTWNNKTYHVRDDCQYSFGKKRIPLIIQDEFKLTGEGKDEWQELTMQKKFVELQDHAMNGIRMAERVRSGENMGVKMTAKAMVGLGIIVVIGIALLMQFMST